MNSIFTLLFIMGTLAMVTTASAEDNVRTAGMDCDMATTIAGKSYERTRHALDAHDKNAAIMYSKGFWDVYSLIPGCPALTKIADALKVVQIIETTEPVPPSADKKSGYSFASTFDMSDFVFPETCKEGGCKILVTTPGQGTTTSFVPPKAYLFDKNTTMELKIINKAALNNNEPQLK
ncbi:hypothetical protein [Pseudomonas sp.]|uniref:hypothetical protein n=1 Tax=Pseudomonas sp. TaxID=306 RepID=UPI002637E6DF|nr:hypothetical protein [Pseudomonas sp.]